MDKGILTSKKCTFQRPQCLRIYQIHIFSVFKSTADTAGKF